MTFHTRPGKYNFCVTIVSHNPPRWGGLVPLSGPISSKNRDLVASLCIDSPNNRYNFIWDKIGNEK